MQTAIKESVMDKKTIFNVAAHRIFNKPLLVNPSYMSILARSMEMQLSADMLTKQAFLDGNQGTNSQLEVVNGAGVIRVYGFLSYRADFESWLFGGTAYEDIRSQFQAALADPTVKNIVFDINSPGGEAAGLFDLVDEIYQARGQKPSYAVFNEDGFSAAFAIASAADKRYISRTGSAGSVGVVAMHIDQSGWDAQHGVVFTPIFAGAHKVDYSSHAPLSPEALAAVQEDINATYDIFVNTVARNLGMTAAAVKATEAGIYQGKKAVDTGFSDSVMSWNQFMTKLTNRKYGGIMKAELERLFNDMRDKFLALTGADPAASKQEVVTKADAEALVVAAETAAKAEGHASGLSEGQESGRKEAMAFALEIMEVCALAGMEKMAPALIARETKVEDARAEVMAEKAKESERTQIRSTIGGTGAEGVNPLMADAKKRAGLTK
jgi:ClpP class serine protease